MSDPLLAVDGLVKRFPAGGGVFRRSRSEVRAVDGVSFSIARGQTFGLVGESGSGKTTVARCILRLVEPSAGRIRFAGHDVRRFGPHELRQYRRQAQLVFQDPAGALDPRMTVGQLVAEPLTAHGLVAGRDETRRRVGELLEMVELEVALAHRYSSELSGGQRQRVVIARALSLQPTIMVLDEPIAALDVSIGAQVLDLLADLQSRLGVAYLLISHDLAIVRRICSQVAVMYLGAFVETAATEALFAAPQHPYTQALLSAVPIPDPIQERRRRRIPLLGEVPGSLDVPPACRFHTRCFKAQEVCRRDEPPLAAVAGHDHRASCWFAEPLQVL